MSSNTASASFPGANGKIAFEKDGSIWAVNPDGSGAAPLTSGFDPAWSPAGTKLALFRSDGLYVANADGTGATRIVQAGGIVNPVWSPDATQIAYVVLGGCSDTCDAAQLWIVNADGSAPTRITLAIPQPRNPDWSPDGQRIVLENFDLLDGCFGDDCAQIFTVKPDGTGLTQLTFNGQSSAPSWSPDGARILFNIVVDGSSSCLSTMNPAGGDRTPLWDRCIGSPGAWAPDGTKIAIQHTGDTCTAFFCPQRDIFVMNPDASGRTNITNTPEVWETKPAWQPIPINAYPRPKGATPTQVALVPAYAQCTVLNRTHGPPLAFSSCNPPMQSSDELTVGTGDSNGKPTKSYGFMRYDAIVGNPATPADDADVGITVDIRDIYEQGTLADYTGELRARVSLRITDKLNTPHPGGPGAATVSDASLGATVPCTATADTTEGAHCNLLTTFDAIAPGTVPEARRSIWALGAAQLDDGGADNDADTPADNTLFMTQGIFIP